MTNSSKLFSFSDEFREWAKQEDAINNQMNSNWIPAYVIITLIPIGFIISAALASRKETKRQASERAARAARIGELRPLWLRNMVFTTRRANNDLQAATGTDEAGIELRDLEVGLAKASTVTTTTTTTSKTGPTDPSMRPRASSVSSDTGAVLAGGVTHDDHHVNLPRPQWKGPMGGQLRGYEHAIAVPSSACGRARRQTDYLAELSQVNGRGTRVEESKAATRVEPSRDDLNNQARLMRDSSLHRHAVLGSVPIVTGE
ncbi:hypothetical protein diail_5333 [Diaporthe ilicicola]|nr:hypothetical protein diail_5333 [Diaporthe ilicicola]